MKKSNIRNFSIIAHIDHGKSTLADRMLEFCGELDPGSGAQVLDDMELEQERGITIKSHAIRLDYTAPDGKDYILNLIDTPGHVDFSYEVSRSLAACEGALLIVDASQGIEAQTVTNIYLAIENDLILIPVLNKIDMPQARTEDVAMEVNEFLGEDEDNSIAISAKEGIGIQEVFDAIIERIPPPVIEVKGKTQALIFDSFYDKYRGVVIYIRIFNGSVKVGDKIKLFANDEIFDVDEVGYLKLELTQTERLEAGEVGYIMANIKDIADVRVGDTLTVMSNQADKPLPGYQEVKPMVYSGIYPSSNEDFEDLRTALSKLKLNDASLVYEPESSVALGFGFRCGFLGLLHLEITQERLLREFDLNIVATVPNVKYQVFLEKGGMLEIENPVHMPEENEIEKIEEPFVEAEIITPIEYVSPVMNLVQPRRGEYKRTDYIDPNRVMVVVEMPLSEIIFDFFDRLKSGSRGMASLDYEFIGYRESDLVKLDILINGELVDALSVIVHRDKTYDWGQTLVSKLKKLIPRQMYEVVIQAAIGKRVISRARNAPLRKNVTAKCYGGDVSRKRKLLERQKEGKKRMKMVGKVEIPQEAFFAVLQIDK
ncbi:MAG: translation elongation factor 4 [Candidatus Zixiibacteriota bacterium]